MTRGGREIFAGDREQLLGMVADGRVRPDDLVIEPETEERVFARSCALIAAHAPSPPGEAWNELREARRKRQRLAVSVGGVVAVVLFLAVLVPAPVPVQPTLAVDPVLEVAALPLATPPPPAMVLGASLSPADRIAAAREAIGAARAILDAEAPLPDAVRRSELLGAVLRARFASFELARAGADAKGAEGLAAQAEAEWRRRCRAEDSLRFCQLKLKHPGWPDGVLRGVAEGRPVLGMNMDQVKAAWGPSSELRPEPGVTRVCYGDEAKPCARSVLLRDHTVIAIEG